MQSRYQNGLIYKIVCKDVSITDLYIGSCCNFRSRKNGHKTNCCNEHRKNYNLRVYQTIRANGGWSNWEMLEIEQFPCNSKRELELRERHWLEQLKANLNCYIPTRSKQEWQEDNKEYYKEYSKQYKENHREAFLEYYKNRYKNNKEYYKKKGKEQYEKKKEYYKQYSKQYKASHKEAVLESKKQYYEKHKDKIKETSSKLVQCECGAVTIKNAIFKHKRSKKHLYYERISKFINS